MLIRVMMGVYAPLSFSASSCSGQQSPDDRCLMMGMLASAIPYLVRVTRHSAMSVQVQRNLIITCELQFMLVHTSRHAVPRAQVQILELTRSICDLYLEGNLSSRQARNTPQCCVHRLAVSWVYVEFQGVVWGVVFNILHILVDPDIFIAREVVSVIHVSFW